MPGEVTVRKRELQGSRAMIVCAGKRGAGGEAGCRGINGVVGGGRKKSGRTP